MWRVSLKYVNGKPAEQPHSTDDAPDQKTFILQYPTSYVCVLFILTSQALSVAVARQFGSGA